MNKLIFIFALIFVCFISQVAEAKNSIRKSAGRLCRQCWDDGVPRNAEGRSEFYWECCNQNANSMDDVGTCAKKKTAVPNCIAPKF